MSIKKVVLLVILFTNYLFAFTYDIELSQEDLQKKIQKKFPYEKKRFLTKVILTNPMIVLKDGSDKIFLNVNINLSITKKLSFDAYTQLNGKILFDNKSKKFYLHDFEIDKLVMEEVPLEYHKIIQKAVEIALKTSLDKYPVYTLKTKGLKNSMTAALLKDIKVENKKMILTLGI